MKLTNANNKVVLFTAFLMSACSFHAERDLIQGGWKYISVTSADSSVIEVSDNDRLFINADSSFMYYIESVNMHKKGKWKYEDHELHLKYADPDTIRKFKIDILSNYRLKFSEGNTVFEFQKVN